MAQVELPKNLVSGIEEERLKALIADVYNYYEQIKSKLNKISNLVASLEDDTSSIAFNRYLSKFENFRSNFPIVCSNIQTYADDLAKVKKNFNKISTNSSSYLNQKNKGGM
ncbi:MAG: hypothetical protein E7164_03610 [Firmicutes bacterium]|nr:hypothetical protein [Bacillota bacterium]